MEDKDKKAEVAFEEMRGISDLMKGAVVNEFPVPEFKRCQKEQTLGFIEHLDVLLDGADKASCVEKIMVPSSAGKCYEDGKTSTT